MIDTPQAVADAERFAARASTTALCLDFDGTLAPIVADPALARPLPGLVALLAPLAARFAAVALVSGRPAAYLAQHVPGAGIRYLGLYGLQELRDGRLDVDERLTAALPAIASATDDLRADPAIARSGAYLEDKRYAIAVHLRRVANPHEWTPALERVVHDVARRRGLDVVPGRLVWELRPAVRDDKGDAVRRVARESQARSLIVMGDDLGDVPAFAAAELLRGEGLETLRVAVRSAETPAALLAHADLVVEGPPGALAFLETLLSAAQR